MVAGLDVVAENVFPCYLCMTFGIYVILGDKSRPNGLNRL